MERCFCHLISDRNAWPRHVSTRAFLANRESLIEKRPFARSRCNGNFQINRLEKNNFTSRKKNLEETLWLTITIKHNWKYIKKKKPNHFLNFTFSNFSYPKISPSPPPLSLKKQSLPQSFRFLSFVHRRWSNRTHSTRNRTRRKRGNKTTRRRSVEREREKIGLMHAWKPIRGSIDSFCSVSLWSATAQKSVVGRPVSHP